MAGVDKASEYDGQGVMPNTVYPKGSDALTPSDKLRLQSLTGQDTDSRAPLNPYHWYGGTGPDLDRERNDRRARQQESRRLRQQERDRYRESPR